MGYYTDNSDDDELAVPTGNKLGYDDNAACIFRDGIFSDGVEREVWIQCGGWAHSECAGMEIDIYISDLCK